MFFLQETVTDVACIPARFRPIWKTAVERVPPVRLSAELVMLAVGAVNTALAIRRVLLEDPQGWESDTDYPA